MNDPAIWVRGLSKRYRIGKIQAQENGRTSISQKLATPFRYLISTIKEPSDDEIIWALKDVSFNVQEGEVLGIIGRNGAGKSTLLKILSRITEPTMGKAFLNGRVGSLLEVGTGFHPELTGRENIYLSGTILGMKRHEIDRKFDEIVAFAETEKFLDTQVKRYSSGMYVRLAFAVAAHLEPEILLVDEVLAVGDASFQKKCLGKMGDVSKEGRTILFVSHNMVAVQNLCERTIWLENGKIQIQGKTDEVVSKYLQNSSQILSEQTWDDNKSAPGNDQIRLHKARVRPTDSSPQDIITMQTPLTIEVEFQNMVPNINLDLVLHIYNEQDILAFGTSSVFEQNWHDRPFPTGVFKSTCFIPSNLLNSGIYKVNLLFIKDQSKAIYRHNNLVAFEVLDLTDRNGGWFGKLAGVVRPKLNWNVEFISENNNTSE